MRLRFWAKSALFGAATVLAVSCVYAVFLQLQIEDFAWSDLPVTMASYLWAMGAFMSMAFTISVYKQYLPIALSFGSTRREALAGIQLFRLIPLAAIILFSLGIAFLSGGEFFHNMLKALPGACGAYLIINSIGTVIGTAIAKFGNKSLFFTVPGLILVFVCAVFIGFFSVTGSPDLAGFLLSPAIVWIALGAGLIVHGLSLIPEIKTVYHFNVKL